MRSIENKSSLSSVFNSRVVKLTITAAVVEEDLSMLI
jgi:hypothetical protein